MVKCTCFWKKQTWPLRLAGLSSRRAVMLHPMFMSSITADPMVWTISWKKFTRHYTRACNPQRPLVWLIRSEKYIPSYNLTTTRFRKSSCFRLWIGVAHDLLWLFYTLSITCKHFLTKYLIKDLVTLSLSLFILDTKPLFSGGILHVLKDYVKKNLCCYTEKLFIGKFSIIIFIFTKSQ